MLLDCKQIGRQLRHTEPHQYLCEAADVIVAATAVANYSLIAPPPIHAGRLAHAQLLRKLAALQHRLFELEEEAA